MNVSMNRATVSSSVFMQRPWYIYDLRHIVLGISLSAYRSRNVSCVITQIPWVIARISWL